jgi:hypothetical protein
VSIARAARSATVALAALVVPIGLGAATPASAQMAAPAQAAAPDENFAFGAISGAVAPEPGLPVGTLEVTVTTIDGSPIVGREVRLGRVGQDNKVQVDRALTNEGGMARFAGLPTGEGTGYAAVVEHETTRLGTEPFRMATDTGMRGQIRALQRTTDTSALRLHQRSRIIFELREDALAVMQQLVFSNNSDKIVDLGEPGITIPLPSGAVNLQGFEGGAKVDLRPGPGFAAMMHAPVSPNKGAMFASAARFGFVLPAHGARSIEYQQPMPYGLDNPLILIPSDTGFTVQAPGVRELPAENDGQGNMVKLYELPAVPPGGTLALTIGGLPTRDTAGRSIAIGLCIFFLVLALAGARRPGRHFDSAGVTQKLVQKREGLFSELMELEQTRRQGGQAEPRLDDRRRELVTKLESVYRDLARAERGESPTP